MAATALVQARIDPAVRDKAAAVLDAMGLTVSDAVRILLTRVAHEGALPAGLTTDPAAHDAWFRAKVQEALDSTEPPVAHDEAERQFAARRASVAGQAPRRRLGAMAGQFTIPPDFDAPLPEDVLNSFEGR